MKRLDGKTAVITGGANGIGRACGELFAAEGAAIVVADVADSPGKATVQAIEAEGGRSVYVRCDATSPDDNEAAIAAAISSFGSVDILVTSAGISHAGYRSGDIDSDARMIREEDLDQTDRFLRTTLTDWRKVIDVNLTGTFLAIQAAARAMLDLKLRGSIITVASIAAKHPRAGRVAYGVSKAGVWMLTKQAATTLAEHGIRVNAIGPGFIDTNMTAVAHVLPHIQEQMLASVPMGRMGTTREVANAALFLASDESSYITGEILHPDGGFYTE